MTDQAAVPINQPHRIVAIHAHPDDIEFQSAGTLWRLKELGHVIIMATMTPGDCGTAEYSAEEIAAIRREENRRSAELIGAEYHCLEFRDLSICHDNPSRKRVTEFLRKTRPDIILTAPPVDYMSDHEMTSRLVRDAVFNAAVPNYVTDDPTPAPPMTHLPHLYYMDAVEGIDYFGNRIPAGFLVDVSGVFAHKRAMLACHESQRNWLRRQHGVDEYLDSQERWARTRGSELGVEYAEAFRQHVGHPYPAGNRLLELLGG